MKPTCRRFFDSIALVDAQRIDPDAKQVFALQITKRQLKICPRADGLLAHYDVFAVLLDERAHLDITARLFVERGQRMSSRISCSSGFNVVYGTLDMIELQLKFDE